MYEWWVFNWFKSARHLVKLIEAELRIYAPVTQAIIYSESGLSSVWHQALIWTNPDILSIGPLGINFSETLMENRIISLKKMHM